MRSRSDEDEMFHKIKTFSVEKEEKEQVFDYCHLIPLDTLCSQIKNAYRWGRNSTHFDNQISQKTFTKVKELINKSGHLLKARDQVWRVVNCELMLIP